MVIWIVLAVVVFSLILLGAAAMSVVGRLRGLERAGRRLQRRQEQAVKLQQGAARLERTLAGLQQRAEIMEGQLAVIKAARGKPTGKHSLTPS